MHLFRITNTNWQTQSQTNTHTSPPQDHQYTTPIHTRAHQYTTPIHAPSHHKTTTPHIIEQHTRSLPLARSARHSLATPSRQSRSVISRAKARSIARASGVLRGAGEDTTAPRCRAGCLPPAPVALLPRAWSAVSPYRRRFGQWLRHLPLVSSPAIPLHNLRRSQPPAP